jgi:bacterioferritin-associated ferredoxin
MYKCICANITDRDIENLKNKGFSYEQIKEKLNIGKECGICLVDDCDKCELKDVCKG